MKTALICIGIILTLLDNEVVSVITLTVIAVAVIAMIMRAAEKEGVFD